MVEMSITFGIGILRSKSQLYPFIALDQLIRLSGLFVISNNMFFGGICEKYTR